MCAQANKALRIDSDPGDAQKTLFNLHPNRNWLSLVASPIFTVTIMVLILVMPMKKKTQLKDKLKAVCRCAVRTATNRIAMLETKRLSSILLYACHIPCRVSAESRCESSWFCTLSFDRTKGTRCWEGNRTKSSSSSFIPKHTTAGLGFWRNYWNLFEWATHTHKHLWSGYIIPFLTL